MKKDKIKEVMSFLGKRSTNKLRKKLGEKGYSAHMSQVRKGREVVRKSRRARK